MVTMRLRYILSSLALLLSVTVMAEDMDTVRTDDILDTIPQKEEMADSLVVEPEITDSPEIPDEPDFPEGPVTPDDPDDPDSPEIPDNPDSPDNPESPVTPDDPDTPDIPDTPEPVETPDISVGDDILFVWQNDEEVDRYKVMESLVFTFPLSSRVSISYCGEQKTFSLKELEDVVFTVMKYEEYTPVEKKLEDISNKINSVKKFLQSDHVIIEKDGKRYVVK